VRLRDIRSSPSSTDDREAQDPFALLDEIHSRLALDVSPLQWPAGSGKSLRGVLDFDRDEFVVFHRPEAGEAGPTVSERVKSPAIPSSRRCRAISSRIAGNRRLAREALPKFDIQAYREGHMTPVFFRFAPSARAGVAECGPLPAIPRRRLRAPTETGVMWPSR